MIYFGMQLKIMHGVILIILKCSLVHQLLKYVLIIIIILLKVVIYMNALI